MTRLTSTSPSGGTKPTSWPNPRIDAQRPGCSAACWSARRPSPGGVEDDDVAGVRVAEVVDRLVDQDAVAGAARAAVQRLLHRLRRDVERLDHEGLDQDRDQDGEHDQRRQLPPRRLAAAWPGLLGRAPARRRGRVGAGISGGRSGGGVPPGRRRLGRRVDRAPPACGAAGRAGVGRRRPRDHRVASGSARPAGSAGAGGEASSAASRLGAGSARPVRRAGRSARRDRAVVVGRAAP